MILQSLKTQVKSLSNIAKAKQTAKFFKTGPGQYGQGDIFYGLTNPQCRQIAKDHKDISIPQIQQLIQSEVHEQRFIALVLMELKFKQKSKIHEEQIYKIYINNTKFINNWDLVDVSAPKIIGKYIFDRTDFTKTKMLKNDPRNILYQFAFSASLWERRISMLATYPFIRANHYEDTLKLAKHLLNDKEDLIHKAVGWFLRQIWSKDHAVAEKFIQQHYDRIPRTALRYAIQKFEQQKRQQYLRGQF